MNTINKYYPTLLLIILPAICLIIMGNMMTSSTTSYPSPVVMGTEDIMAPKAHGTCPNPPQENLRWNCDYSVADKICCNNRHFAEYSGYFQSLPSFSNELKSSGMIEFYDSVSGDLLFKAPVGRTVEQFLSESKSHGWPSFRDAEVNWNNVRVLPGGETVSTKGTHLGHNLPDSKGNRYCINLVCIAGSPKS
jgi:peptide methionine sulfoxide reductase MsrB